jgi:hypothetical protein
MKVIELIISDELKDGIEAISVVDRPAIEENFIALSEQIEVKLAEVDPEKKILMGAALIPNKQIYRKDKNGNEFYVYFSSETIRKASELFFIHGNQSQSTLQHNKKLEGLTVVESWLIDDVDMDKSKKYGFSLPVGSWMISMKVDNPEIWDKVKSGEIKGFSIEGYFADKLEMQSEEELLIEKLKTIINGGTN